MPDRILAITLIVALSALLQACGQKGPLFLPGDPSQISTTIPAQSAPQEQSEDEESEDDENPEKPAQ